MKTFKLDLHIHSCLSPCADLEMSPMSIVEKSLAKGLDGIAVCDHNSAENAAAVVRAGVQRSLHVLPGMEINSVEEVHTLAIFDTEEQALSMQDIVYQHLSGSNRPDVFGDQIVVNEFDEVAHFNDKLLIGATQLKLHEVVDQVHRLGGLSIASHVDRPSYSILSQLGFIPPDLELDALEVSYRSSPESFMGCVPGGERLSLITSSDAHFNSDIGKVYTSFLIEIPSVEEIRMAFRGQSGRRVIC